MSDTPVRLPLRLVARRFAYRLARYPLRDPSLILLVALLAVIWLVLPVSHTAATSTTPPATDSAEQYLRALRDRDIGSFLSALSPQARQALELRAGATGPVAAAAWFREQEQRGERVVGWEYVGAYRTVQGEDLRFYVVRPARGDQWRDVPCVLAIDAQGKVARVD